MEFLAETAKAADWPPFELSMVPPESRGTDGN